MAKQDIAASFLDAFRQLEQTLRLVDCGKNGSTVLEYESTLPPDRSDLLRFCRIARNQMVHNANAKDFFVPSKKMVEFLQKENDLAMTKVRTAKEIAIRVSPIKPDTTVRQACKLFNKYARYPWLPAVDANGCLTGTVTPARCIRAVSVAAELDGSYLLRFITKAELGKSLAGIESMDVTAPAKKCVDAGGHIIITRKGAYYGIA